MGSMTTKTKPSKQAAMHISAYDRYSTECQIYGISPRPIHEWLSLPTEGTPEMQHERKVKAENAAAPLTTATTLVVAPVRHAAASVRKLRTLSEKRAEDRTRKALKKEQLRATVASVATKCGMDNLPTANRPVERELALAERERWIQNVLPQILDCLGLDGAEGLRLAKGIAEAWLSQRELDTERRLSRGYQERMWRQLPSSGWKGMELGETPADTISNSRNSLRATSHSGHNIGTGLYSSLLPVTKAELTGLKLRYEAARELQAGATAVAATRSGEERQMLVRGLLFPAELNPMMD